MKIVFWTFVRGFVLPSSEKNCGKFGDSPVLCVFSGQSVPRRKIARNSAIPEFFASFPASRLHWDKGSLINKYVGLMMIAPKM